MKRLLLVLIFVFTSILYFSQEYIPFPDSVATWGIDHHVFQFEDGIDSHSGISYHLEGDTLINDTLYSKLFIRRSWGIENWEYFFLSFLWQPYELIGGIREDSEKKVWYRNLNFYNFQNGSSWVDVYLHYWLDGFVEPILQENTELMIYDFGLAVGDSIYFREHLFTAGHWETVIDVSYDIVGRRTTRFSFFNYWFSERLWVEGIGDVNAGLLSLITGPEAQGFGEGFEDVLTCFSENDELIYGNEDGPISQICYSSFNGVKEYKILNLSLSPNPTTGQVNIPLYEGKSSLEVYDHLGKLLALYVDLSGGKYELDISSFSTGLYYVVLKSNRGAVSTGKVVKL